MAQGRRNRPSRNTALTSRSRGSVAIGPAAASNTLMGHRLSGDVVGAKPADGHSHAARWVPLVDLKTRRDAKSRSVS